MSIELFRKFGLHASADALAARDAYREGKTCRTCVHLDSDPRVEPCGTCRRFEKWQDARAEQSKAPNGVMASDPHKVADALWAKQEAVQPPQSDDYQTGYHDALGDLAWALGVAGSLKENGRG